MTIQEYKDRLINGEQFTWEADRVPYKYSLHAIDGMPGVYDLHINGFDMIDNFKHRIYLAFIQDRNVHLVILSASGNTMTRDLFFVELTFIN